MYVSLGNSGDIYCQKPISDDIVFQLQEEEGEFVYRYGYEVNVDRLKRRKEETSLSAEQMPDSLNLKYLSAYRMDTKDRYQILNERELRKREFGNNGEYAIEYLGLYGNDEADRRAAMPEVLRNEANVSLKNVVEYWLNWISPGVSPIVRVDFETRHAELNYSYEEGREITDPVKSIHAGFGITYVLSVIVQLVTALPGEIIMLENPEAHLHPTGQVKLGGLIAEVGANGTQVIVETHSDHIINGIRVAVKEKQISADDVNVIFFHKDEATGYRHKAELLQMDENAYFDEWPEGFQDEWEKALFKLL